MSLAYLIFSSWCDVEPGLSHDGHIEVMNQCHFEALGAFVIVTVVERLDVEEHRVAVVLSSFRTLKNN